MPYSSAPCCSNPNPNPDPDPDPNQVPMPFAYVQFNALLLNFFILLTPLSIACFTTSMPHGAQTPDEQTGSQTDRQTDR